MFDIGGYELILIAAVAILVVGPRELPGMLRSVGRFVTQARQMMAGVQRQFNDALKEAELDDVKKTIDDVRSLNPATKIRQTIAKELKPISDAGDSVKKAVGEVKVKGPAPAAATATATSVAVEANASEGSQSASAKTSTEATGPKTTAAKAVKKPAATGNTAAKKAPAKKTTAKKPAAKSAAKSSTGSTLTQAKPRKAATAAASEAPSASTTSVSDGG